MPPHSDASTGRRNAPFPKEPSSVNRLPKLLLLAALLLVGVGVVLSLVQPFGLGDEEAGTETAQPDLTETETETETGGDDATETETATAAPSTTAADAATTTSDPDTTATTTAGVPSDDTTPTTTGGAAAPSTTVAPSTSVPVTTTTTRPSSAVSGGSGLDGEAGLPADLEDGLADTGGTSVVGGALVLALAGLALRRRTT